MIHMRLWLLESPGRRMGWFPSAHLVVGVTPSRECTSIGVVGPTLAACNSNVPSAAWCWLCCAAASEVIRSSVARALANCSSLEPDVCPELTTATVLVDAGALPLLIPLVSASAKPSCAWDTVACCAVVAFYLEVTSCITLSERLPHGDLCVHSSYVL